VELTAGGRKQYRWIHSNQSYKSGGALEAHFGLGKHTRGNVTVVLLNGKRYEFRSLAADRYYDLDLASRNASVVHPHAHAQPSRSSRIAGTVAAHGSGFAQR